MLTPGHADKAGRDAAERIGDRTANAVPGLRDRLRGPVKRAIVTAACWGFPASWAQWLIQRGGLSDA